MRGCVKRVVGAVEAWRAWRIAREADGSIHLMSMAVNFKWEGPVAKVDPPISMKRDASTRAEVSGIHAFVLLETTRKQYEPVDAVGKVALTGKVMVHQFGYRAERALITKLWIPSFHVSLTEADITHLEERYQCDVVLVKVLSWRDFWDNVLYG